MKPDQGAEFNSDRRLAFKACFELISATRRNPFVQTVPVPISAKADE
jgi:hypothetical protein